MALAVVDRRKRFDVPSEEGTHPVNVATNHAKGFGLTSRKMRSGCRAECVETRLLSSTEAC